MELFLNTSNPLMIFSITIIIALVIFISRKSEMTWPLIIAMVAIIGFLIYHTVSIDNLQKGSEEMSIVYHCIACDLIFLLISFMSYLWVDDIMAKNKKLKSYDDSLSWFWDKL